VPTLETLAFLSTEQLVTFTYIYTGIHLSELIAQFIIVTNQKVATFDKTAHYKHTPNHNWHSADHHILSDTARPQHPVLSGPIRLINQRNNFPVSLDITSNDM
jgi:hypothetical protein